MEYEAVTQRAVGGLRVVPVKTRLESGGEVLAIERLTQQMPFEREVLPDQTAGTGIPARPVADDYRRKAVAVAERFRLFHRDILVDATVNVTMPAHPCQPEYFLFPLDLKGELFRISFDFFPVTVILAGRGKHEKPAVRPPG